MLKCPDCKNPVLFSVNIVNLCSSPIPFVQYEKGEIKLASNSISPEANCEIDLVGLKCTSCNKSLKAEQCLLRSEMSDKTDVYTNFVCLILKSSVRMKSSIIETSTDNRARLIVHKSEVDKVKKEYSSYEILSEIPVKSISLME